MSLINFYKHGSTCPTGHTIEEIIVDWGYDRMEYEHQYIQWLFPLNEPSLAVPNSPVMNSEDIALFKADTEIRVTYLRALHKMLCFYGLGINADSKIIRSVDYPERSKEWITPRNHNYLRLTRILKSLKLFGFTKIHEELKSELLKIATENLEIVGERTIAFWKEA